MSIETEFYENIYYGNPYKLRDSLNTYTKANEDEIESLKFLVKNEVLPDLLSKPDSDPSRFAICMTMVDSRELSEGDRVTLGLEPEFSPQFEHASPIISTPWDMWYWPLNCSKSEELLTMAHRNMEVPNFYGRSIQMRYSTYPFIMYDSLVCKRYGYLFGYSTQSVEFANGVAIIKGSWYEIRNHEVDAEVKKRQKLLFNYGSFDETKEYYIDATSKEDGFPLIMAEPNYVVLCPTRRLYGFYKYEINDDPETLYDSAEDKGKYGF